MYDMRHEELLKGRKHTSSRQEQEKATGANMNKSDGIHA